MKILIISTVPTHPITAGNRKAILNQVELFKKMGHEVYLLYIHDTPLSINQSFSNQELCDYWDANLFVHEIPKWEHAKQLLIKRFRYVSNRGYSKVDDYFPRSMVSVLRKLQLDYKFDCCIVNYYFLTKAFCYVDSSLKGLLTHDYFAYKDILVGNTNIGYATDANQEATAMQRSPHIFALNTEEADYFQRLSPKSKVYNVFSSYTFIPTPFTGNDNILLFSGDNQFNITGFKWFVESIFPVILEVNPQIKLIIGGSICKRIGNYKNNNIELMGFVKDPYDFYKLGDIVINPTFQGTGLKIKTFEAISFGKAVIAHPHSITGIYDVAHSPVYSSDNPIEWAEYIQSVISNKEVIESIKSKDEDYIKRMNEFILNEYNIFFNSDTAQR